MASSPRPAGVTVAGLLHRIPLPVRDARELLAHVLQRTPASLVAHPEQPVTAAQASALQALVARCVSGEPLAYVIGVQPFFGRSFEVTAAVLIPRPETEDLVAAGLARIVPLRAPRVLDLGTGSGCIAITIALERPDARVVAVERSAAALAVAIGNARRLGANVRWHAGSWFEPLAQPADADDGPAPDGAESHGAATDGGSAAAGFDLIIANPPYVAAGDPHLAGLRHEPIAALVGGHDGLTGLRSIIGAVGQHLAAGGWLLVEHGYDQSQPVQQLMRAAGLQAIETLPDGAGIARIGVGRHAGVARPDCPAPRFS
jgi:release factor glutamine methyltransferase